MQSRYAGPRRRAALAVAALSTVALAACTGGGSAPRSTASPTRSATATPSTPSASPSSDSTAPLTGLPVAPAVLRRPIVAVKIDNVGPARPPVNVDHADLVVEEPVEGGLTRLMAVFQSRDVGTVGPVRSARVTDASLMRAFGGGALVFSGASGSQLPVIRSQSHALVLTQGKGPGWRRDPHRQIPHNLFADVSRLRPLVARSVKAVPRRQFAYSAAAVTGVPTHGVALHWTATRATWTWSPSLRAWWRTQDGTPHVTSAGRPIITTNVVLLQVRATQDRRFHDFHGSSTPILSLTGTGRAWLLRDGVRVAATWTRPTPDSPFRLSVAGRPLALRPGTAWVELLPMAAVPRFS